MPSTTRYWSILQPFLRASRVHFCREGSVRRSVGWGGLLTLTLILSGLQASPVSGQIPSAPPSPTLEFTAQEFAESREGYVQLEWNEVPGAVAYEVREQGEGRAYYGAFNQAFISGLSDGEYQFSVAAFGPAGELIVASSESADITVRHWPLAQALALFGVGLCVFLAVVIVIAYGSWSARVATRELSHRATEQS